MTILFFTNCKNSNPGNIELNYSYTEFQNLDFLNGYEKISDTSFVDYGNEPTHRVTELKKDNKRIILFSKISLDKDRSEIYSLKDTLIILSLSSDQFVSIGYCYKSDLHEEEIISIVQKTDKRNIQKILKAWRANPKTEKIEELGSLENLDCINEYY